MRSIRHSIEHVEFDCAADGVFVAEEIVREFAIYHSHFARGIHIRCREFEPRKSGTPTVLK